MTTAGAWLVGDGVARRPAAVRPILGLWLDGGCYFITAETTQKGKKPGR